MIVRDMSRAIIYEQVDAERAQQDAQWGGGAHDDGHTPAEWATYIHYQMRRFTFDDSDARARLVKVAALAVAAIESLDRLADDAKEKAKLPPAPSEPDVLRYHKVDSSNLESVGYSAATRTLQIVFKGKDLPSGRTYRYEDVPAEIVASMLNAKSVGAFFSREIKPHYVGKKVVLPDVHSGKVETFPGGWSFSINQIRNAAIDAYHTLAAYSASLGESAIPAWAELPGGRKDGYIEAVRLVISGKSDRDMHLAWMRARLEEGWVYGLVKDVEKKVSPALVDYDNLPAEQKCKDGLFRSIVINVLGLPAGHGDTPVAIPA